MSQFFVNIKEWPEHLKLDKALLYKYGRSIDKYLSTSKSVLKFLKNESICIWLCIGSRTMITGIYQVNKLTVLTEIQCNWLLQSNP